MKRCLSVWGCLCCGLIMQMMPLNAAESPVYPVPRQFKTLGDPVVVARGETRWTGLEDADPAAARLARQMLDGWDLDVAIGEFGDMVTAPMVSRIPDTPEGYWLGVAEGKIYAVGRDGAGTYYALQSLRQLMQVEGAQLTLPSVEVRDAPVVPVRGTVEGFYGQPWSHEARLRQIEFYGQMKLNTYIYGPKDDPFHGFSNRWRDPYPPEDAARMKELIHSADLHHVRFVWAVHPGRDIRWEDTDGDGVVDDMRHCLRKFELMYDMGVRSFAVFFDDIGGEGARAEKQVEMLNYLNREFVRKKRDVRPLILCPTQYNRAWSGGDYLDILGRGLDADIEVMWTGNSVCADVTREGSDWIAQRIRRKSLIWWNWPVSDYCRSRLLIGRTYGLEVEAAASISGLVSNPMDKPEASKIGLFGVADFTWNPEAFDSDASWRAGIRRLFPGFADAMQQFANHHSDQGPNTHGYRREESVAFAPVLERAALEWERDGTLTSQTVKDLRSEFESMQTSASEIKLNLPAQNHWMWEEIQHWVQAFQALGMTGVAATEMLQSPGVDPLNRMLSGFARMEEAGERHRQKGLPDQWARPAVSGGTVVLPFLEKVLRDAGQAWLKQQGVEPAKAMGEAVYGATTNIAALQNPAATREGIYVRLNPVREVIPVQQGEWIALSLPPGVSANYVHLKLGDPMASERGEVQLSVDGETWQTHPTRNQGGEMQSRLDPAKGFRFMRYLNTSPEVVELQIEQFKLDVPEDSRANLTAAMQDGNLETRYVFEEDGRILPPEGRSSTRAVVISPRAFSVRMVPALPTLQNPIQYLEVPAGTPVHEVIWK